MNQCSTPFDDIESIGEALQSIASDGGRISRRLLLRRLDNEIAALSDIVTKLRAEQMERPEQ